MMQEYHILVTYFELDCKQAAALTALWSAYQLMQ